MLRLLYAVLALLPWALSSCVLTMEDYTLIPEDERGIGQPYTYSDSLVTCTYEFNPGVTPLTDEAINYVVGAQDSTIFFLDNLPEKWLPKVGGYVSAGNSRKFPYGLGHRVTNVQHANGMYAVTLTQATPDDIFKELDIKASLDAYEVPGYYIEEETPDTLFDENGNVLQIFYPDTTASNEAAVRRGLHRFTRADAESTTLELDPSGNGLIDWRYVDSGNNPQKPDTRVEKQKVHQSVIEHDFSFSMPGNIGLSFNYKQESTNTITSWYEENKKKKTSTQWSQNEVVETTTLTGGLQLEGGVDAADFFKKTPMDIPSETWYKICEKTRHLKVHPGTMVFKPQLHNITIPFLIGPVPFAFVVRFDASLNLVAGGTITYEATTTSDVWRTTVTTTDGERKEKTKLIKKGHSDNAKTSFTGHGGVELSLRVAVGVMCGIRGNGVGLDIGAGLKSSFKFESEVNPISSLTESMNEARIVLEASWVFDAEAFVDLFGNNVWNGRYTIKTVKFLDKSTYFSPRIDHQWTNGSHRYIYDSDKKATVHHVRNLCFSQLWTGVFAPGGNIRPVMRVYKGPLENYDYTELKPVKSSKGTAKDGQYQVTPKVDYKFEYDADPTDELHFVPALYCEANGKTYEMRKETVSAGEQQGDPIVEHIEAYQESVNEDKDWTEDRNGTPYDTYHIADVVRLERTQNIWEAGVYIDLVDSNGKVRFRKLKQKMLEANDIDGLLQPGDYKFRFYFSIPASGRWHYVFEQLESMPVYPILTIAPYTVIYRGPDVGTEEVKYRSRQIYLRYPYKTNHNYRSAIEVTQ